MKLRVLGTLTGIFLLVFAMTPFATADDEVMTHADLVCHLTGILGLSQEMPNASLPDEVRFQQCLSLLPAILQDVLVALLPEGPVTRENLSSIFGTYMEPTLSNSILGGW